MFFENNFSIFSTFYVISTEQKAVKWYMYYIFHNIGCRRTSIIACEAQKHILSMIKLKRDNPILFYKFLKHISLNLPFSSIRIHT